MARRDDLDRFYDLMDRLETKVGGKRVLADCDGYMDWPDRGVYFFFANDERRQSTDSLRISRIGTHAVSEGSGTTLWNRLRTHRGNVGGSYEGGGNHRGSVFRKAVGEALINREGLDEKFPHWGVGSSAGRDRRLGELELERRVSRFIRGLPFLWLDVDDEPGADSDRAYIERNAIALVSNCKSETIDPRSNDWLGRYGPSSKIRRSGIWNIDHVDAPYEPTFLSHLESALRRTGPP